MELTQATSAPTRKALWVIRSTTNGIIPIVQLKAGDVPVGDRERGVAAVAGPAVDTAYLSLLVTTLSPCSVFVDGLAHSSWHRCWSC